MLKKEKVKPLAPGASLKKAAAAISATDDGFGGDVEVASQHKHGNRRRHLTLCCGATVATLGLLVLILALTFFRIKDPFLTMNSVWIESIEFAGGAGAGAGDTLEYRLMSMNATLTLDISIKNPNAASFRFHNSTTGFYYRAETVGVAYAPGGTASPHRTVRMNVTVDVLADRVVEAAARALAAQPNLTAGILVGPGVIVPLSSYTEVQGRVSVWGVYRRYVDVKMNCTMTLDYAIFGVQEITNKVCGAIFKK